MNRFVHKTTLSALAASLLLTVGCSSSSETTADGKVKINFLHWRGEDSDVFKELIAKFEAENQTIDVEMSVMPSEQYQSTAQTKLADGQSGDVFTSFPGAQFETIAKANLFADLTNESFVTNYEPNLIKAGQKDGKQFALPLQLVYNQPVYNVELFNKYNLTPPTDWEGFLKVCETLKANGITPIAFPGADVGPGQFMNSMLMNNAPNEDVFTKLEAGDAKLTDAWWTKTLSQFKELNDKGYIQKDSLGTKQDAAVAYFAQGKAAMLATGSYAMASAKKQNAELKLGLLAPITVSAADKKWDGIHTTTFMLAVNSKSQHQTEAKKFIDFLSRKDNAEVYANKTSQHVTVKGVNYTSPELKDTISWTQKNTRFQPRFLIQSGDVQKAVTSSIQDVLSGTAPEEAAAKAQKLVEQKLKK